MNVHLELLAADQSALRRMRTLLLHSSVRLPCEDDLQVMEAEINRVLTQLAYWEEMVDRLGARPAEAARAKGPQALSVAVDGVLVERRSANPRSIDQPARSGSRTSKRPKVLVTR